MMSKSVMLDIYTYTMTQLKNIYENVENCIEKKEKEKEKSSLVNCLLPLAPFASGTQYTWLTTLCEWKNMVLSLWPFVFACILLRYSSSTKKEQHQNLLSPAHNICAYKNHAHTA